jgi:hypothetical protein
MPIRVAILGFLLVVIPFIFCAAPVNVDIHGHRPANIAAPSGASPLGHGEEDGVLHGAGAGDVVG